MQTTAFIACDWGTSNFRLRLIEPAAPEKREFRSDDGVAKLAASAPAGPERSALFRATLARALEQLNAPAELPVLISGMASSSIGWKELPYATLPFPLNGQAAIREQIESRVWLISGLRSDRDVMRGEETQALGLAASLGEQLPKRAVFILPGTHSKHVEIDAGAVVSFRTQMVGELFDLLTRHSVLRHSTAPASAPDDGAFVEGVAESQRSPLLAGLFRVRTRQVLDGLPAASNTSFLSGVLIGAELAGWRDTDVTIIVAADEPMRQWYRMAGENLGLGARLTTAEAEPLSALGQAVLWRKWTGVETN